MLTTDDHEALNKAIHEAEIKTSAMIKVAILPSSNRYQEFVLLYGFIIGSGLSIILWNRHVVTDYPWLLCIQLSVTVLCDVMPLFRQLCVKMMPRHVLVHHARQMAYQEYHHHHSFAATGQPFVLLFVSLAEHYVHVVTNPTVHEKIPDNWQIVTDRFASTMKSAGLSQACVSAIQHISEILAPQFPAA